MFTLKRFTCSEALHKTMILLAVTWLLQFPDLETDRQALVSGGKSSSLKGKEMVAGMDCLEISLYVLRLLDEKLFDCSVQLTFTLLTLPV